MLVTSISGNSTTFISFTPKSVQTISIETMVVADKTRSEPGAGDPFRTPAIIGLSFRGFTHGGERGYGPVGAFIDVGDPRKRDIHGGGSSLKDPFAPRQKLTPTLGCTRGHNNDVINLGHAITSFQINNVGAPPIPYNREQ
jgi:hypothetical protein